jgi:hypothetical protein
MSSSINPTVALDTPIWQLTPRQLFEMQEQWFKENLPLIHLQQPRQPEADTQLGYTNSFTQLAKTLGISVSTVHRHRAQGVFQKSISKVSERRYRINLDKALLEYGEYQSTKRNWK